MAAGEYEVLRNGKLAGKQRASGDSLTPEEAAQIAPPVLSALINEGWIKPIFSMEEEKMMHLQSRVDVMAEDRLELRQAIADLQEQVGEMTDLIRGLTVEDTKPATEAKAEPAEPEKVEAAAPEVTYEAPKPKRSPGRPRKAASKKE